VRVGKEKISPPRRQDRQESAGFLGELGALASWRLGGEYFLILDPDLGHHPGVLEGFVFEGVVAARGAADPARAADSTLRKRFGSSIGRNATHGSDKPESAAFEVGYFFSQAVDLV
jgi:hypothetical protein